MTFRLCKRALILFCAVIMMLVGTFAFAAEAVILGDVDGDGEVAVTDASCIQRTLARLSVSVDISEQAADIDSNGVVEVIDVTYIQRFLAKIDTPYLINEAIGSPSEAVTEPPTEAPTQPSTLPPTDDEGWGHTIYRP